MYRKFLRLTKSLTVSFEKLVNFLTTKEHNPLYFHGALPLYCFWLLIFSGILLWMYYIPTLDRAWSSVNYISALPTPGHPIDLAGGIPYDDLGADFFTRRLDPDKETRRLIARLEAQN